jgi:hypothetical protein
VKRPADPAPKVNLVQGLDYYYAKNSLKSMEVKSGWKVKLEREAPSLLQFADLKRSQFDN